MARQSTNSKAAGVAEPSTAQRRKPVASPALATKKARLIAMLSRKDGAELATLSTTFGWLPHTTRAALTGLRKAGYEITSVRSATGKPSRYRIIAKPAADVA